MAVLLSLHQSSELKPRPNYPHLNGRPHPPSTAPRLAAKLLGLSMILLTVLVPVADSSLSDSCNRPRLFRAGALSSPIIWQPERVVKPGNTTAQWINPVVRLDSNNQAWIGYMDNSNSVCGGNGIQVPAVIHSQGTNYAAW